CLADRHHHATPVGVLAGDRRLDERRIGDRERDAPRGSFGGRPFDDHLDKLARPLAVAGDLLGKRIEHLLERAAEVAQAAVAGAPRARAAPVANASSVSDVEVSLSTVTALKLSTTPSLSSACSAGAAIGASVNTKASMVAMSMAIMPEPLAMPLMATVVSPSFAVAVATFGKVSVVMIALAASIHPLGAARAARSPITSPNFSAGSGSP